MNTITTTEIFAEMREALGDISHAVQRLSAIYRRGLENDPDGWAEMVRAEFPTIPARFWDAVELVSAGKLLPDVIARGCSGLHLFGKMSLNDQRRVLDRGFAVWAGGSDHRMIPAHLADMKTLSIVLDRKGHIFTVEEQAARSREQEAYRARLQREYEASLKTVEPDDDEDDALTYRAVNGRIFIINLPTSLTKNELRMMLADLEASQKK